MGGERIPIPEPVAEKLHDDDVWQTSEIDDELDKLFEHEARNDTLAQLEEMYGGRVFSYKQWSGTVSELTVCPMFSETLQQGVAAAAAWLEANDQVGLEEVPIVESLTNEDETTPDNKPDDRPKDTAKQERAETKSESDSSKKETSTPSEEVSATHQNISANVIEMQTKQQEVPDTSRASESSSKTVVSETPIRGFSSENAEEPKDSISETQATQDSEMHSESAQDMHTETSSVQDEPLAERHQPVAADAAQREEIRHVDDTITEKNLELDETVTVLEQQVEDVNEPESNTDIDGQPLSVDPHVQEVVVVELDDEKNGIDEENISWSEDDKSVGDDAEYLDTDELALPLVDVHPVSVGEVDENNSDEAIDVLPMTQEFESDSPRGGVVHPENLELTYESVEIADIADVAEEKQDVALLKIEEMGDICEMVTEFAAEPPDTQPLIQIDDLEQLMQQTLGKVELLEKARTAEDCHEALAAIRSELAVLLNKLGYTDANTIAEQLVKRYDIVALKNYITMLTQALKALPIQENKLVLQTSQPSANHHFGVIAVRQMIDTISLSVRAVA